MSYQELRIESGGKSCAMGAILIMPGIDTEQRIHNALGEIPFYFTTADKPKSAFIRRCIVLVAYRDLEKSVNRLEQADIEVTNGASISEGC